MIELGGGVAVAAETGEGKITSDNTVTKISKIGTDQYVKFSNLIYYPIILHASDDLNYANNLVTKPK